MFPGRSHSMWHYLWVGISVSDLNVISILVAQGGRPLDCGEWGANSENPDEWDSINSVITGQLSQGQRGSHTIQGVWESLQGGEFCEKRNVEYLWVSQEVSLLPNWRLCCSSREYTARPSGAVAPTEMKARSLFLACSGSFVLCGLLSAGDEWGLLCSCGEHGFSMWWFL